MESELQRVAQSCVARSIYVYTLLLCACTGGVSDGGFSTGMVGVAAPGGVCFVCLLCYVIVDALVVSMFCFVLFVRVCVSTRIYL